MVDDGDLVAAQGRTPLLLRRAIARAQSQAELAAAAAGIGPMTIALHDARATAEHLTAVRSVVLDALIRRLAELAVRAAGAPPVPFTWFALGSLARREAVPSSDVDSALGWDGEDASAGDYAAGVARAVAEGLRACGLPSDAHGASAASPLFARSLDSWHRAARSLAEDPTQEQGTDPGVGAGRQPAGVEQQRRHRRRAYGMRGRLRIIRSCCGCWPGSRCRSGRRPGSWRDFVVEHSGERRGQLDLKHGGIIPIVDLARWAGMAAGVASAPTPERLRAAEAAGTMEGAEAQTLMEAFGFIGSLRLDHQVEQLKRGSVAG